MAVIGEVEDLFYLPTAQISFATISLQIIAQWLTTAYSNPTQLLLIVCMRYWSSFFCKLYFVIVALGVSNMDLQLGRGCLNPTETRSDTAW